MQYASRRQRKVQTLACKFTHTVCISTYRRLCSPTASATWRKGVLKVLLCCYTVCLYCTAEVSKAALLVRRLLLVLPQQQTHQSLQFASPQSIVCVHWCCMLGSFWCLSRQCMGLLSCTMFGCLCVVYVVCLQRCFYWFAILPAQSLNGGC